MFDNNSKIFLFNYIVKLDNIVRALCDISFDIGNQLQDDFSKEDLFSDAFLEELSIRKTELVDFSNEEFFSYIADYYNKAVFNLPEFIANLVDSDILYINKEATYFYGYDEKTKDRLMPAIRNSKILDHLIAKIKNEKIQRSLEKINLFEHDAFYSKTVESEKLEGQPMLAYLSSDLIDFTNISREQVDVDNYWVNLSRYKRLFDIDLIVNEDLYLLIDKTNDSEIGILIGEYLIPYSNIDLIGYVQSDKLLDYFWQLISDTYSIKTKKAEKLVGLTAEFKALNKDKGLNQLLSFLKNNLYVDKKVEIKENFSNFFNEVLLVDQLEHLTEYEFLLSPSLEESTLIGVYTNEKKGTSYNLLHWINNHLEGQKFDHYKGNIKSTKKEKLLISALKPEVCYYFLEKYFEDLLEDIFVATKYNYLSNITLNQKSRSFSCEVDFFVRSNNKLYYIEAKTKLSKLYIEAFLKKASKMIDKFIPILEAGIEIEFILLGGYSDINVKDFQYFIDEDKTKIEKGYNLTRADLNSIPYHFKVPIPDKENKKIVCIAEPEYDKLTQLILEVCPQ
jgi:hypothetical protein